MIFRLDFSPIFRMICFFLAAAASAAAAAAKAPSGSEASEALPATLARASVRSWILKLTFGQKKIRRKIGEKSRRNIRVFLV